MIKASAQALSVPCQVFRSWVDFANSIDLANCRAVVDLYTPDLNFEDLANLANNHNMQLKGFFSHVDEKTAAKAKACNIYAIPRSQLSKNLAQIVKGD